jgi:Tfp pilus assembly protein PilV
MTITSARSTLSPSRRQRPDSRHGSTILEVLVAIVIFAIALLSLMAGSLVAARAMVDSRSYAAAAVAAQTTIDSLRAAGWDNIADATGSYTVKGHAVNWVVSGDNPRRVVVTVTRRTSPTVVNDVLEAYVSSSDVAR